MKTFVYDGSAHALSLLGQKLRDGFTPVCPVCAEPQNIILDAPAVAIHKMHPGIYCKKDFDHFAELHEICQLPHR